MTPDDPDAALVGVAGSRARLTTPALVLDRDALDANIATMAAWCRRHGIGLRPHAKTHKSPDIARRQVAAGALGQSCATLGEAEAMVAAGIPGVLVTSPMTTPDKVRRVAALAARGRDVAIAVDDAGNADALGAAARAAGATLGVLVDVEVGSGRSGVTSPEAACALARHAAAIEGLRFLGIQAYNGAIQSVPDVAERRAKAGAMYALLHDLKGRLAQLGLKPERISGGGTGTHDLDRESGVFTEVQAGSYAVMDAIYNAAALRIAERAPFRTALFVRATVNSATHAGFVTTDAGYKAFAADSGPPLLAAGAPPGATYAFMGDEHGRVTFARAGETLPPGAGVECIAPHCDPTINLYDAYRVVQGDTLVALWPIARGRW